MPWTLPKPWENGYVATNEVIRGGIRQGKPALQRVWRKQPDAPVAPILTLPEYAAYILSQTAQVWSDDVPVGQTTRKVRVTPLGAGSTMWGSPWETYVTRDSSLGRVVRHALPSVAALNTVIADNSQVLLSIEAVPDQHATTAVNRNGYTSSAYTVFDVVKVIEAVYWDGVSAKIMHPFLGLGPVELLV